MIGIDQPVSVVWPTLVIFLQKRPIMGSRPFPETPCALCSKPVNLGVDLCADENGKAVHEACYVQQVTSPGNPAAAIMAN
jgi:hypothetical protein